MSLDQQIADQIDAAFDFRGHVTVTLKDGRSIEGYLFNRELSPARGRAYVEVIRKDSDERVRFDADDVARVALSGKDFAVPFVPPAKA